MRKAFEEWYAKDFSDDGVKFAESLGYRVGDMGYTTSIGFHAAWTLPTVQASVVPSINATRDQLAGLIDGLQNDERWCEPNVMADCILTKYGQAPVVPSVEELQQIRCRTGMVQTGDLDRMIGAVHAHLLTRGYREQDKGMKCPKDLCDAVNNSDEFQWIVYDMDLMPEQIRTREQVCALRAAWMMYNALNSLRSAATPPPINSVREAVEELEALRMFIIDCVDGQNTAKTAVAYVDRALAALEVRP
jgi:hypothetical protein